MKTNRKRLMARLRNEYIHHRIPLSRHNTWDGHQRARVQHTALRTACKAIRPFYVVSGGALARPRILLDLLCSSCNWKIVELRPRIYNFNE